MLNPMAALTPSNHNDFIAKPSKIFLGYMNLYCVNEPQNQLQGRYGSSHEEREIPVASLSTGLQKHPRGVPTCLILQQCQKTIPLREVHWQPLQPFHRISRLQMFYKTVHNLTALSILQCFLPTSFLTRNHHQYHYIIPSA